MSNPHVQNTVHLQKCGEIHPMSVALLWAGRGKLWVGRGVALPSGHTPDTTSSCVPTGFAGWRVKPGVGFLEKHALLQRMEKAGAPPPPASLISVSILASELKREVGGRGGGA